MIKVKIKSESIGEWNAINDKLQTLHPDILNQIEWAENGLPGIECHTKPQFDENPKLNLPNTVTQITDFGEYIGVYAGDFFFKAPKPKKMYTFVIIKPK